MCSTGLKHMKVFKVLKGKCDQEMGDEAANEDEEEL